LIIESDVYLRQQNLGVERVRSLKCCNVATTEMYFLALWLISGYVMKRLQKYMSRDRVVGPCSEAMSQKQFLAALKFMQLMIMRLHIERVQGVTCIRHVA
jgi:hypothetical protein